MVVHRCKQHLQHSAVAASLFPSRKTRCSHCGRSPCGKTERTFLCKIISFLLNLRASDQIIFRDQVLGLSSTFQQQVCSSKSLFSDTSTQDCRIVCSNFVGCMQQKFFFSSSKSSSPPPLLRNTPAPLSSPSRHAPFPSLATSTSPSVIPGDVTY